MTENNSGLPLQKDWKKIAPINKALRGLVSGAIVVSGFAAVACQPTVEARPVKGLAATAFLSSDAIVSPETFRMATLEEQQMLEEHEKLTRELEARLFNPNILKQYPPFSNMIHPEDLRIFRTMAQAGDSFGVIHSIDTGNTRGFRVTFKTTFWQGKAAAEEVMFSLNQGYRQFPDFPGLDSLFRDEYRRPRSQPYTENDIKIAVGAILNLEKLQPKKQFNWRGVVEKGWQSPSLVTDGLTPEGERYELKAAPSLESFTNDEFVTVRISPLKSSL